MVVSHSSTHTSVRQQKETCSSVLRLSPSELNDKQQKTPAAAPHLLSASLLKDTEQSQSGGFPELMQELIKVWQPVLCSPPLMGKWDQNVRKQDSQQCVWVLFCHIGAKLILCPCVTHMT